MKYASLFVAWHAIERAERGCLFACDINDDRSTPRSVRTTANQ